MRSAIEREKKQARGIVIRHGGFEREHSAFWAYLWSEESVGSDESDESVESDGLALALSARESIRPPDRQAVRL